MRLPASMPRLFSLALLTLGVAAAACDRAPQEDASPTDESQATAQAEPPRAHATDDEPASTDDPVEADASPAAPRPATTDESSEESSDCTGGAKPAFSCEFRGGGGATVCVEGDAFAELRLEAPDASPKIYRHLLDPKRPTVRYCEYTSPHRTWLVVSFFEQDRAVSVASEFLGGNFAGTDSDVSSRSVDVRANGEENQHFECESVEVDKLGMLDRAGVERVGQDNAGCDTPSAVAPPAARRGAPAKDSE